MKEYISSCNSANVILFGKLCKIFVQLWSKLNTKIALNHHPPPTHHNPPGFFRPVPGILGGQE